MKFHELKQYIALDLERIDSFKLRNVFRYYITNASFKITFWYRVGNYLNSKSSLISKVFLLIVKYIHKSNQYKTGIQLPIGTNIGSGLMFSHYSCIVINDRSIIGNNCTIFQGVTIGSKRGNAGGVPLIGNNCVIAAGAKIIGNVRIGNSVVIGANSVVVNDVADYAVVAGNPAKVLNFNGAYHAQLYMQK